MTYPHHPGRMERSQPQLPAFCRTRQLRPAPMLCRAGSLRRMLVLVLILQVSTLLLVLAGPVPPAAAPLLRPMESRP